MTFSWPVWKIPHTRDGYVSSAHKWGRGFAPPPPNLTPLQPSPRGKASTESSLALALGEMFRHVDPVQLDAIGQVATSIENAIELVCMLKEILHGHTLLLAFV